jgi:TPR repeat protein
MTRGDWSDFDQAVQWYHKAAEQNCADAQFELARHYYYGCGVVTNYSLSKSLLMKSAQHGNLNAQKILNERSLRDRISGKIPMPDYYKCNFVVPKCRILPGKNNKLYLASVI